MAAIRQLVVTRPPARVVVTSAVRLASIDWMRGLVMVLMVIDHASMAFDGQHVALDSAMYAEASTMALPAGEFFTRWITHLCAPTFVFLAGTALALSVERRAARGEDAWKTDKNILTRGAIIALLDPTIVSLGSGRLTFQVLLAIGVAMMCMAPLRRLPSWLLLMLAIGWLVLGEFPTDWVWDPPGATTIPAALILGTYGTGDMVIKYPVIPWLAMMMLGWVFGRRILLARSREVPLSPQAALAIAGVSALAIFVVVRMYAGYGDMFLHRGDHSWQEWLHVSKYPPSLSYSALELGILWIGLAILMAIEPRIGVRQNGPLIVFGQTAMFFYLVHRLAFEIPATYFGLRGVGDLSTTYIVSAALLVAIYPACRWYRDFKSAHRDSFLKYL